MANAVGGMSASEVPSAPPEGATAGAGDLRPAYWLRWCGVALLVADYLLAFWVAWLKLAPDSRVEDLAAVCKVPGVVLGPALVIVGWMWPGLRRLMLHWAGSLWQSWQGGWVTNGVLAVTLLGLLAANRWAPARETVAERYERLWLLRDELGCRRCVEELPKTRFAKRLGLANALSANRFYNPVAKADGASLPPVAGFWQANLTELEVADTKVTDEWYFLSMLARGRCYAQIERYDDALATYRRIRNYARPGARFCRSAEAYNVFSAVQLAYACGRRNRTDPNLQDEARTALDAARKLLFAPAAQFGHGSSFDQLRGQVLLYRGSTALIRGDLGAAAESFGSLCRAVLPDEPELAGPLPTLDGVSSDAECSEKPFAALSNVALVSLLQGRLDQAKYYYQRASGKATEGQYGELQVERALAYLAAGDTALALKFVGAKDSGMEATDVAERQVAAFRWIVRAICHAWADRTLMPSTTDVREATEQMQAAIPTAVDIPTEIAVPALVTFLKMARAAERLPADEVDRELKRLEARAAKVYVDNEVFYPPYLRRPGGGGVVVEDSPGG